jgi:hypothetical protein
VEAGAFETIEFKLGEVNVLFNSEDFLVSGGLVVLLQPALPILQLLYEAHIGTYLLVPFTHTVE